MLNKKKVLMVCLGNTCRSTIAEAVFKYLITKMELIFEWEVDSAGLRGYHIGQTPDERAITTLRANGIMNYSHYARILPEDSLIFNWILAMDDGNMAELNRIKPQESKAEIKLLGEYDPNGKIIIRDPYCDYNCGGFVKVYEQRVRSILNFLQVHQNN